MRSSEGLLNLPKPGKHLAQFYTADDSVLSLNVGRFLHEGFDQGAGLIVISIPANAVSFRHALLARGVDVESAIVQGHLVFFDASETLSTFLVDGEPDWERFDLAMCRAIATVDNSKPASRFRVYGEMVGLLWAQRKFTAAIQVEQFWNRLLLRFEMHLFCGYPIDIFGPNLQGGSLDAVLCAHTHLVPSTDKNLEAQIHRAMDERLGGEARRLKQLMRSDSRPAWAKMSAGERAALWLRNNLPREADQILEAARELYARSKSDSLLNAESANSDPAEG
jgi:hypothetical protein